MAVYIPVRRLRHRFPWLRTLKQKILLAFVLVVLLAVGNIIVVRALLSDSDGVAATINIAGKMRMLSQRVTLEALATPALLDQDRDGLDNLMNSFDRAYHALMSGGTVFGLSVAPVEYPQAQLLEVVGRDWQIHQESVKQFVYDASGLRLGGGLSLANSLLDPAMLVRGGEQLLSSVELLLDSLVFQAGEVQKKARYSSYILFLLNLLLLLIAYAVVLGQILRPIEYLVQQCRQLKDGNYAARSDLRRADELGRLGQALNDSAAHIERLMDEVERERRSLKQAALVYTNTSEAMVVTDADGYVQDINPAFTVITGYTRAEVIGKRLNMMNSGRQDKAFYQAMWSSLMETGHWSGDLQNRRKNGEEFTERLTINTSYNDDGSVNSRVGLFSDVTEKRRREAAVWRQAHYDQLTELPNRRMFQAHLQRSIDASQARGEPFALMFLDLDFFKTVNDTHGHDEGDELLRQVARRLTQSVREDDMVARLGGDEFTLVFHGLGRADEMMPICQKLLQAMAEPYTLKTATVGISASIGVAFYPSDGQDPSTLLKHADQANYLAKNRGRNQCALFVADAQELAQ